MFFLKSQAPPGLSPTQLFFTKFVKFIAAVEAADWEEAARQMKDSRWHVQLPQRSGRLIDRMRALA